MAARKMSYAEVTRLVSTVIVSTVGPGMEATGGQVSDDDLTLADSEMSEENTDLTLAVGEISDEETYQELIEKEMCEEKIELTLENEENVEEKTEMTLEKVEEKTEIALENEEKTELSLENMEMCDEKTELSLENNEIVEEKTELALENKELVDENRVSTLSENDISVKFKVILTEKEQSEINTESKLEEKLSEEVSEESSSLLERWATKLTLDSVPKQLAAGGAGGLVAGYLAGKAPKSAAVGVLGSLLLLRIAEHKGLLKKEMTQDDETVKETEDAKATSKSGYCPFQEFAAKNVYVIGGFTGGILVGIASSWKC